jgi:diketogulonate reductase-like aldo/keto reductase
MPTPQPSIKLNDGHEMPRLGFGVWQIANAATVEAVKAAIGAGYRLIDTAAAYGNEAGTGEAVRDAGVPREELYVTTKLWNDSHGHDEALRAFDASMKLLGLESLDLYLIHWPIPRLDRYVDTWRALVRLRGEGRVKSIGVSNFNAEQIQRLADETGEVPAVNQVELHPMFQQTALRSFHAQHGIVTEAWSPLGRAKILEDETLVAVARKHGKTPAQVVLRWHLDNGIVAIPKTVSPQRMRENIDILGFELDADDLARIARLDDAGGRVGPDPASFPV